MANTSGPFGFRQYKGNGSAPTYEQVLVRMAYNAGACFQGDPVTQQSDGTYAVSVSTGSTPAALGIGGIFGTCTYISVSQKRRLWGNYWPDSDVANTGHVDVYITNDPNSQFLAQSDSTGLALVDVNATIGFAIGTGNTANGISGAYLDTTTLNTVTYNVDAPFKVIAIYDDPPGAPGTLTISQAYDYAVVAFNNVNTRNFTGV